MPSQCRHRTGTAGQTDATEAEASALTASRRDPTHAGAAEIAGIRAIVVHAIDETAARFYERQGFLRSPAQPLTLVVTLKDVAATLR
jgi:hypothetical protein